MRGAVAVMATLMISAVALARAPLARGQAEVNQASERIVQGDYRGAEPLLRQAVVDAPTDPYAHFNLATVLRATNRPDQAIVEYRKARQLFEQVGPRANGAADISDCLYGIALAEEARDDAQAATGAWRDYIAYAQRFAREQPAVAIARSHVQTDERLARSRAPSLGPQKASRPSTTR